MAFRKAQAARIGGKFLSFGETSSGKSTFQLTFPKVACIDSETGVSHYEGKTITLNNGKSYNNLVLVDNTADLDVLEEDLDAFLDGEYDGQIETLSIDSETKFYNNRLSLSMGMAYNVQSVSVSTLSTDGLLWYTEYIPNVISPSMLNQVVVSTPSL